MDSKPDLQPTVTVLYDEFYCSALQDAGYQAKT